MYVLARFLSDRARWKASAVQCTTAHSWVANFRHRISEVRNGRNRQYQCIWSEVRSSNFGSVFTLEMFHLGAFPEGQTLNSCKFTLVGSLSVIPLSNDRIYDNFTLAETKCQSFKLQYFTCTFGRSDINNIIFVRVMFK